MARNTSAAAAVLEPREPLEILSPRRTCELTNLSAATIWRLRKRGEFPHAVRLSPGRMGWRRSEVLQWLADRQNIARLVLSPNPRARRVDPIAPPRRTRKR